MSLQDEMETLTTTRPLGAGGTMVAAKLPSQEAILASEHWPAVIEEVEKMARGTEVKFLAGGRDKVVLDIGGGYVVKLLPTTKEDGIGIERGFRKAVKGAGLEVMAVPVTREVQIGDILIQVQPKLTFERINRTEVLEVRRTLAKMGIAWIDGHERNLGRMSGGRLVMIDGSLRVRGFKERLMEILGN